MQGKVAGDWLQMQAASILSIQNWLWGELPLQQDPFLTRMSPRLMRILLE